jgi:outer membrane protein TolC
MRMMILLYGLALMLAAVCPILAADRPISLEDAVARALAHDPDITKNRQELEEIRTRLSAADPEDELLALARTLEDTLEKDRIRVQNRAENAYIDLFYGNALAANLHERVDYLNIYRSRLERGVRLGQYSKKDLNAVDSELAQTRRSYEGAISGRNAALDTLSLLTAYDLTLQTPLSEPVLKADASFKDREQRLSQAEKTLRSAEKMLKAAQDDLKYGRISNTQYNMAHKTKTEAASAYLKLRVQYSKTLSDWNAAV